MRQSGTMKQAMKIRQSPKLPAEDRRRQLLAAAQKLFRVQGYRGTTIEEIAREAKVTKGAFYHHFRTKEDILFALIVMISERHDSLIARYEKRRDVTPLEFLRELFGIYPTSELTDFRAVIDIWVQGMRLPRIRRHMDVQYERVVSLLAGALDRRYGRSTAVRRNLALLTVATFDGLAVRKCLSPSSVSIESQLRIFGRMVDSLYSSDKTKSNGKRRAL